MRSRADQSMIGSSPRESLTVAEGTSFALVVPGLAIASGAFLSQAVPQATVASLAESGAQAE